MISFYIWEEEVCEFADGFISHTIKSLFCDLNDSNKCWNRVEDRCIVSSEMDTMMIFDLKTMNIRNFKG